MPSIYEDQLYSFKKDTTIIKLLGQAAKLNAGHIFNQKQFFWNFRKKWVDFRVLTTTTFRASCRHLHACFIPSHDNDFDGMALRVTKLTFWLSTGVHSIPTPHPAQRPNGDSLLILSIYKVLHYRYLNSAILKIPGLNKRFQCSITGI